VIFVHKFWNQVTTELYMPVILFIAPSLSSVNLVTTLSLILVTFSTIVVHKFENQVPAPLNNSLNRVNALSFIALKYSVTLFQIESAVSFRISPKRSQSPSIIAATPDIIPCIKSIVVLITNLIVLHVFLTRYSIVGHSTPHMPSTIGANLLNKSTTKASDVSTTNVMISNTLDTTVPIASKINAPSESHHDFTSVNAPTMKSLIPVNILPTAFFISRNIVLIPSTESKIIVIVSSLNPIDVNISVAVTLSPLNASNIPDMTVLTLSIHSFTLW